MMCSCCECDCLKVVTTAHTPNKLYLSVCQSLTVCIFSVSGSDMFSVQGLVCADTVYWGNWM